MVDAKAGKGAQKSPQMLFAGAGRFLLPLALSAFALVSGCGYFNTIHRKATLGDTEVLSVDAKQRFLLYGRIPPGDAQAAPADRFATCAEPSPDTFSSLTAELAGQLRPGTPDGASIEGALEETVRNIGRRTQTIQILRDGYYRLCEAYLNGAIDESGYRDTLSYVDGAIVAVLGIDILGGAETAAGADQNRLSDAQVEAVTKIVLQYLAYVENRALLNFAAAPARLRARAIAAAIELESSNARAVLQDPRVLEDLKRDVMEALEKVGD